MTNQVYSILFLSFLLFTFGCNNLKDQANTTARDKYSNVLDYQGNPLSAEDNGSFAFSDLGAWFAYGFPADPVNYGGFSGPLLMTQANGVWISQVLSQLELTNTNTNITIPWSEFKTRQTSYNSHLEQVFKNNKLEISQTLTYVSPHSTLITTQITNTSNLTVELQPTLKGEFIVEGLILKEEKNGVVITSNKSNAIGIIQTFGDLVREVNLSDSSYSISLDKLQLSEGESKRIILTNSFIFPEYSLEEEQLRIAHVVKDSDGFIESHKNKKEAQLENLFTKMDTNWNDSIYKGLVAKCVLTLQNNWRIPAGQLSHHGLFPSYQYKGFHGFWAWDSWKHAAALAHYDTFLAQEQIRAMYDFQTEDGFIPDCIFRDTTIENHNYRDTKPPLSGWAIWKVYEQSQDLGFLKELYPKLVKQHKWWYANRDHDNDRICEYGSTDGSLIAAKWESGMDNAVRFDHSTILKNSDTAFSLNQESVDLNAYLYAEKQYLIQILNALNRKVEAQKFEEEAQVLKEKIQNQFFDPTTGWFYDTSLDGQTFIDAMGCEGWIPLWAEVASREQAEEVKKNMMNPDYFNTKVPLQTLSANHSDYEPNGGYWRGPTWIDQSYFGIIGLHNYSYHKEAYEASHKLLHHAEGVLEPGKSIRENYNPNTGKGLEAENFSWSASSFLLLLLND